METKEPQEKKKKEEKKEGEREGEENGRFWCLYLCYGGSSYIVTDRSI